MAARAPKAMAAMCWLSVGHVEILMPADAGMKVVQLLRGAVECRRSYDYGSSDRFYELRGELDVEYAAVKAGEVRAKKPEANTSHSILQLGHEPLKLPRS
jgi:hypothetical protein